MKQFISAIDSNRFGFRIARVDVFEPTVEAVLGELKSLDVKLVITRIQAGKIQLINELERLGFSLKDIQLTYKFEMQQMHDELKGIYSSEIDICEYKPEYLPQIISITKDAFNGHGHYFADNNLDRGKCLEAYVDWAINSCEDSTIADIVYVAVLNGEVLGYLPFKLVNTAKGAFCTSTLAAVAKQHRGRNVIKMLTVKGLDWGQKKNVLWEEHKMLATNYPLSNALTSLGFRPSDTSITYHHWL